MFNNKKLIIKTIASAFILIISFFIYNNFYFRFTPKIFGIHDPEGVFDKEKGFTLNSDYFAWNKDISVIREELEVSSKLGRYFMITVEPWPDPVGYKHDSNDDLLKEILAGKYDQKIIEICGALSFSPAPVYVRWGHEMELKNSRYPWSNTTPELYIETYKYFVDKCRKENKNLNFVWSPAGENGLEKYWPGKNYVDVVGLSIYSFDEYDLKHIGHKRSFKEVFNLRYDRVKNYKKPIFIAEMGVTGADNYKLEWIGWMMKDLPNYKLLMGVVYLNTIDPQAIWEDGLTNPDWRLPQRVTQLLFPKK